LHIDFETHGNVKGKVEATGTDGKKGIRELVGKGST